MSFCVRVRRRDGLYWWTASVSRPRHWSGPWCSKETAIRQAREWIHASGMAHSLGHAFHLREADLRQMAWVDHRELRDG